MEYANKQNFRYCGSENDPQFQHKRLNTRSFLIVEIQLFSAQWWVNDCFSLFMYNIFANQNVNTSNNFIKYLEIVKLCVFISNQLWSRENKAGQKFYSRPVVQYSFIINSPKTTKLQRRLFKTKLFVNCYLWDLNSQIF